MTDAKLTWRDAARQVVASARQAADAYGRDDLSARLADLAARVDRSSRP